MEELRGSEICQSMAVVLHLNSPKTRKETTENIICCLLSPGTCCPSSVLLDWHLVASHISGEMRWYHAGSSDWVYGITLGRTRDSSAEVMAHLYCWLFYVVITSAIARLHEYKVSQLIWHLLKRKKTSLNLSFSIIKRGRKDSLPLDSFVCISDNGCVVLLAGFTFQRFHFSLCLGIMLKISHWLNYRFLGATGVRWD